MLAIGPAALASDALGARRRIAFVLAGLGAGGAERVVSLIAGEWARRGYDITLIAFDRERDPVFHAFDPAIRIVRLGVAPGSGRIGAIIAAVRRWRALRRTLIRIAPDVTIAFLIKINVLTLLASVGTRLRVIISERNNPRLQPSSRLWRLLLSWLAYRADAIVMQTCASLACLSPATRRRARVIANPIEIGRASHSASHSASGPAPCPAQCPAQCPAAGPPMLVAVGRLCHQKGFDLLIRAFALVADHHPNWRLTICGEGPERDGLQLRIDRAGLADRIIMPGNSPTPDAWTAIASAFVLSSRYEGFSNVLAEAMAAGLPVAAFDCDFSPAELIAHDRNGILVANGDPTALAQALGRIMGDSALRARLGVAARQESVRFSAERIVTEWDAVVDGVIGVNVPTA